jgi:hypothetical protein
VVNGDSKEACETWKDVKRRYWSLSAYRLPVCTINEEG